MNQPRKWSKSVDSQPPKTERTVTAKERRVNDEAENGKPNEETKTKVAQGKFLNMLKKTLSNELSESNQTESMRKVYNLTGWHHF